MIPWLLSVLVQSQCLYRPAYLHFLTFPSATKQGTTSRCNLLLRVALAFMVLNKTCTTFLFYSRVCAVYAEERVVRVIFGILLLLVVGCLLQMLDPSVLTMLPPDDRGTCILMAIDGYRLLPSPLMEGIFDASVCFAISHKLVKIEALYDSATRQRVEPTPWWKSWLPHLLIYRRSSLQRLSTRFLRDSQFYLM